MIIRVTDHAVLRYLERIDLLDVETTRQVIADLVQLFYVPSMNNQAVVIDSVKYVIETGSVVTVYDPTTTFGPGFTSRKTIERRLKETR